MRLSDPELSRDRRDAYFFPTIHQEWIVLPENVDAIRASLDLEEAWLVKQSLHRVRQGLCIPTRNNESRPTVVDNLADSPRVESDYGTSRRHSFYQYDSKGLVPHHRHDDCV